MGGDEPTDWIVDTVALVADQAIFLNNHVLPLRGESKLLMRHDILYQKPHVGKRLLPTLRPCKQRNDRQRTQRKGQSDDTPPALHRSSENMYDGASQRLFYVLAMSSRRICANRIV